MRDIAHFVNGQALAGSSIENGGRFGDVFNPNTGEVQARVPLATDAELDAGVQSRPSAAPG
jgi:malonate-semialdehyde dehydrogenase (acetylating) / methylmalonate-semialdehyde dehydrogenase